MSVICVDVQGWGKRCRRESSLGMVGAATLVTEIAHHVNVELSHTSPKL